MYFQFPHVTHHEVLVDAFRLQNKPKYAVHTITEVVKVSCELVTERLLRNLVKIAKHEL